MHIMHLATQNRNRNAGDLALCEATRRLFDYTLAEPITWDIRCCWEPFDVDAANQCDAVIVGGGGLLLPDQAGAEQSRSGWQWNSTCDDLARLRVPLLLCGVGWNTFYGQPDFAPPFREHLTATVERAAFAGLRDQGSIERVQAVIPAALHHKLHWQPCPTTAAWQLYAHHLALPAHEMKQCLVNVATDRAGWRFAPGAEARTFEGIASVCAWLAQQHGWHIEVVCHKPEDRAIQAALLGQHVPHTLTDLSRGPLDLILGTYARSGLVLGMRGHAQLLALGLRRPVVSMVSHPKLWWTLDDIGRQSWGVDVSEPQFPFALMRAIRTVHNDKAPQYRIDVQAQLWEQHRQCMQPIMQVLQPALV